MVLRCLSLWFVILLSIICDSAVADETQNSSFEILALPNTMDPNFDAWYKIPQNANPEIFNIDKVYRNQMFNVAVLFNNYALDNANNVDIQYDIIITDPKGNITEDSQADLQGYKGKGPASPVLLLNQQLMIIYFTKNDEFGEYMFEVKALDNVSGLTATQKFKVELMPFNPASDMQGQSEFSDWMTDYYQNNRPEFAIHVTKKVVKANEAWAQDNLLQLTFLSQVFSTNAFLWDYVSEHFSDLSADEQRAFVLIDAVTNSGQLNEAQVEKYSDIYRWAYLIKLPEYDSAIKNAYQMDAKWALFFASGKIEPIESIVDTLELHASLGIIDKIKAGDVDKNDANNQKAYEDALLRAAMWSLKSNATRHDLVFKYALWLYENTEMSRGAKNLLYTVLTQAQKARQSKPEQ